jgi:hypothetical protein
MYPYLTEDEAQKAGSMEMERRSHQNMTLCFYISIYNLGTLSEVVMKVES